MHQSPLYVLDFKSAYVSQFPFRYATCNSDDKILLDITKKPFRRETICFHILNLSFLLFFKKQTCSLTLSISHIPAHMHAYILVYLHTNISIYSERIL